MSNQPVKIGTYPIFRDNPFSLQVEFATPEAIVSPVVVEIWRKGILITTAAASVSGSFISFTLSKDLLNSLTLYLSYDLYVKMGTAYQLWAPITITTEGSVSDTRSAMVSLPSVGVVKISTYSDFASVQEAKLYSEQAKTYRDESFVNSRTYIPMGDWNATTNTPTLTSTAPVADAQGRYREYIITDPGNMLFGISNVANGAPIGYGTLKAKAGGLWFYSAADSAALDRVAKLENTFSTGVNLFDYETMVEPGGVDSAGNGTVAGGNFRGTMNILPNTTYTISNRLTNLYIRFGNAANTKVGFHAFAGHVDAPVTFTTPATAEKMLFSFYNETTQGNVPKDKFQVQLGTPTEVVTYPYYKKMEKLASKVIDFATLDNAGTEDNSIVNRQAVKDYLIENKYRKMDGITEYSLNLADPKYIVEHAWVHNTAGRWIRENDKRALVIPLIPETAYRLTGRGWNTTLSFFTSNKGDRALISQITTTAASINFTTPAHTGDVWLYTSIDFDATTWNATNGTLMLSQGVVARPYEAPGVKSFTPTHIEDTPINFVSTSGTEKQIKLADRSLIGFWSNSYSEGYPALPTKDYISVISQFSDWGTYNYGLSGQDVAQILTRVRADTARWVNGVTPTSYKGGGYIVIMDLTNSSGHAMFASGYETYFGHVKNLCEIALANGYQPIIASEWKNSNSTEFIYAAMSEFANQNNIMFADVYDTARFLIGSKPAKYYSLDHPGVRTNRLLSAPFSRYINTLPRPEWGIKIFRKRAQKSVATIADLGYNTIAARAEFFKEIHNSTRVIQDGFKQYYDDLAALSALGYKIDNVFEYDTLQAGGNIPMQDYMLTEFIINSTSVNTKSLKVYIGASGLTTYAYNRKTQVWDAIANTAGTITIADPRLYLQYDKLSILSFKASAFTIEEPYILFDGIEGKKPLSKPLPARRSGTNLLATSHFNAGVTGWTVTGTMAAPAAANDNSMPTGVTQVATISTGVTVRQSVTLAASTTVPVAPKRKAQIVVVGRYNPASYPSSSTYPVGSPITEDTFDFAKVKIIITKGANSAVSNELVGLWWEDIRIDCDIQSTDTTISVAVQHVDKDFELASVSLVIE
jgi:hypothetical protein